MIDLRDHPGVPLDRLAKTKQVVHIPDLRTDQSYIGKDNRIVTLVEIAGARTFVAVPMLKESELIGAIDIYRQEVRPFTDKQIELVQELCRPGRDRHREHAPAQRAAPAHRRSLEALEQQTATADVLKVISTSPGQLEPVFNAMLENAVRVCGAKFGILYLSDGDGFRTVAMHDVPRVFAEKRRREPFSGPLREVLWVISCGRGKWRTLPISRQCRVTPKAIDN